MEPRWNTVLILGIFLLYDTSVMGDCPPGWPPIEEICALSSRLDGTLYFPGDPGYTRASIAINTLITNSPSIVIEVASTRDIQEAILFAQTHRIRPTIASTGHCFLGRSSGNGTIHINLSNLKRLDINLDDPESPSGISAYLGTGLQWEEVFREADKLDVVALGGGCPSVGLGGFILGGGFGSNTRALGLSVDSVLSMTMVTAAGEIVEVNPMATKTYHSDGSISKDSDPSLFWALRGGNGGTFGIVTEFKYQLFPSPKNWISCQAVWPMNIDDGTSIAEEIIEYYFDWTLQIEDNGVGATLSLSNSILPESTSLRNFLVADLLYHGPYEDGWPLLEPMCQYRPEWQVAYTSRNASTYIEYVQPAITEDPRARWYTSNRLLSADDIAPGANRQELVEAMLTMKEYDTMLLCHFVMFGGKIREASIESSSVGADYRNATYFLLCIPNPSIEEETEVIQNARQFNDEVLYKFGAGMYPNEAEVYHHLDFKTEYWRDMETYNRLLEVKDTWDPNNIFICHHCVGSDREYTFNELFPPEEGSSCACQ